MVEPVSVCAFKNEGKNKKAAATMPNNGRNVQVSDTRGDEFCTGADFIIIIVDEIASPPLANRNKNTFPYAFRFQMIKFYNFILMAIGTKP